MALKIPLTCTSVIHSIISPSKMTDDQNAQKMLVDCTHIVDIEFSVYRRIYSTVDVFTVICMRNNAII